MPIPWDELRLSQVEDVARHCDDACGADVVSLVAEVRRLQRLLDRAYPWLHNPYVGTSDVANAAEGDAVIREVEHAIAHLKEQPDPLLALPCASCDGTGKIDLGVTGPRPCPNCRDVDPRAALAYEHP